MKIREKTILKYGIIFKKTIFNSIMFLLAEILINKCVFLFLYVSIVIYKTNIRETNTTLKKNNEKIIMKIVIFLNKILFSFKIMKICYFNSLNKLFILIFLVYLIFKLKSQKSKKIIQ